MNPTRCPRNHFYTPATEKWYTHSNGKRYRTCAACAALRARLRYRHDVAFRESEKARSLARYHAQDRRAQGAVDQDQTKPQHDRHAPA
jgi:hypothetical protein